jgi:accessory gene regulator protein AgrB
LNGENALRMKLWKKRENFAQLIKPLVRFGSVFLDILFGYLLTSFANNYLILGSFISNHLRIWCWFKGQIRKVNMVKLEMLHTLFMASIELF